MRPAFALRASAFAPRAMADKSARQAYPTHSTYPTHTTYSTYAAYSYLSASIASTAVARPAGT